MTMRSGNEEKRAIAIDGPTGAGKSTVAKELAKVLNFMYVDTGAMYRAVALYCINNNIDTLNEDEVLKHLEKIDVALKIIDGVQNVFLNGENVSGLIRTQEVSEHTSRVSTIKAVRQRLVTLQREIAKNNNVVMDGRDIASVVLPNAALKIFLTASVSSRTLRRIEDLKLLGKYTDYETIKAEIEKRDFRDSTREVDALRQTEDAVLIDSSNMNLEEVVSKIITLLN